MKNSSGGDILVEMVYEILSRLPVKSLMRFKCVSKHWLSIIEDDDSFIDLYHSRSRLRPCFALFVPIHIDFGHIPKGINCILPRPCQANILIADLCEGVGRVGTKDTKIGHSVKKTTSIKFDKFIDEERLRYDGILKPVNGLICFTDTTMQYGVCIYNMGTRELTPWMSTTFRRTRGNVDPKFQFGYDPATKKHEVICLRNLKTHCYPRKDSDPVYVGCQVLTLGDNTWRSIDIDQVPQHELEHGSYFGTYGSVYVNGSIYWITSWITYIRNSEEKVIVAFDVGSEKFRTIPVPKFIDDQIMYDREYMTLNFSRDLLEVNDCVALYNRLPGGYTVKLWILDCDDYNKKDTGTTHTTSCNQNWTETTIQLPFQWDSKRRVVFHGIPGTDEIIIETYEDRPYNIKCISLVSYNYKNMT
ncbi:hypothetical protein MKW98_024170 [Papaver atlanticum]|uniref:F-box domain-containing protein n=1 Tax=Papaver atlanticum TaxID=357466 RepID=A0AAD4T058_9MAGN|nr:hypothetical protein MKW98_024170 [Papaver atlanticum]